MLPLVSKRITARLECSAGSSDSTAIPLPLTLTIKSAGLTPSIEEPTESRTVNGSVRTEQESDCAQTGRAAAATARQITAALASQYMSRIVPAHTVCKPNHDIAVDATMLRGMLSHTLYF